MGKHDLKRISVTSRQKFVVSVIQNTRDRVIGYTLRQGELTVLEGVAEA